MNRGPIKSAGRKTQNAHADASVFVDINSRLDRFLLPASIKMDNLSLPLSLLFAVRRQIERYRWAISKRAGRFFFSSDSSIEATRIA
jgi:hypothetical protein